MPKFKFGFVVLCLAAFAFQTTIKASDTKPDSQKMNVVLILIDDMGWKDLACYGSTFYKTPNIDRLAKNGVRLTQFYSACPVCSPTRISVLTGQYPQRFGVTDWIPGRKNMNDTRLTGTAIKNELPLDAVTIAEVLKTAKYETASIGKWHLGGDGFGPENQGFDLNIAGNEAGSLSTYFAPFVHRGKQLKGLEKFKENEYITDRLTDEAITFFEKNQAKPFFLYMPHYTVHTPMNPKPQDKAKYPNPLVLGKQSNPDYAAMIENLDENVGRMMDALDRLKLTEKTIVIFTSDNGGLATNEGKNTPPTINSPLREGKGFLYEGGIRVPCIFHGPDIPKGKTSDQVANSNDFFATILDFCGVKREEKTDSMSLKNAILKDEKINRAAIYWHYPHYANQSGRPSGAIRKGDFKLIEFYEDGRRELFNIKSDMGENKNIADENAKIVNELYEDLNTWRKSVNAQMPSKNKEYIPNPETANGLITLPARNAVVHGSMLRFEPLPHKNTLGYWVNQNDWAEWDFTVKKPGKFEVVVMQGCGKGMGGSEVEVEVKSGEKLTFIVEDTGGFQEFKERSIGVVTIEKAGLQSLTVKAKTKAKVAVVDIRQIVLKKKAD